MKRQTTGGGDSPKRPRGRPATGSDPIRQLRVAVDLWEFIERAADELAISTSEFVRSASLSIATRVLICKETDALVPSCLATCDKRFAITIGDRLALAADDFSSNVDELANLPENAFAWAKREPISQRPSLFWERLGRAAELGKTFASIRDRKPPRATRRKSDRRT